MTYLLTSSTTATAAQRPSKGHLIYYWQDLQSIGPKQKKWSYQLACYKGSEFLPANKIQWSVYYLWKSGHVCTLLIQSRNWLKPYTLQGNRWWFLFNGTHQLTCSRWRYSYHWWVQRHTAWYIHDEAPPVYLPVPTCLTQCPGILQYYNNTFWGVAFTNTFNGVHYRGCSELVCVFSMLSRYLWLHIYYPVLGMKIRVPVTYAKWLEHTFLHNSCTTN